MSKETKDNKSANYVKTFNFLITLGRILAGIQWNEILNRHSILVDNFGHREFESKGRNVSRTVFLNILIQRVVLVLYRQILVIIALKN